MVTATKEEQRKEEDHGKDGLMRLKRIMTIWEQKIGLQWSKTRRNEGNCTDSQGPQQTVELEEDKEEEENKNSKAAHYC